MKNEIKKINAVIRVRSNNTQVIKERGFTSIDEAEHMFCFLEDIVDEIDIFFRLDWYAGDDMPNFNGEYWFGKRKEREAE